MRRHARGTKQAGRVVHQGINTLVISARIIRTKHEQTLLFCAVDVAAASHSFGGPPNDIQVMAAFASVGFALAFADVSFMIKKLLLGEPPLNHLRRVKILVLHPKAALPVRAFGMVPVGAVFPALHGPRMRVRRQISVPLQRRDSHFLPEVIVSLEILLLLPIEFWDERFEMPVGGSWMASRRWAWWCCCIRDHGGGLRCGDEGLKQWDQQQANENFIVFWHIFVGFLGFV